MDTKITITKEGLKKFSIKFIEPVETAFLAEKLVDFIYLYMISENHDSKLSLESLKESVLERLES